MNNNYIGKWYYDDDVPSLETVINDYNLVLERPTEYDFDPQDLLDLANTIYPDDKIAEGLMNGWIKGRKV